MHKVKLLDAFNSNCCSTMVPKLSVHFPRNVYEFVICPFACITIWRSSGIQTLEVCKVHYLQIVWSTLISCLTDQRCTFSILFHLSQQFLIIFWSGLLPGHSRISTLFWARNWLDEQAAGYPIPKAETILVTIHNVFLLVRYVMKQLLIEWALAGWPCGAVLGSWPKSCEFDPGSWQLLGERGSTLSLTLAELYGL